jgi:hypothetical protein
MQMGCQYQKNLKAGAPEPCEMNQTDTGKAQAFLCEHDAVPAGNKTMEIPNQLTDCQCHTVRTAHYVTF